MGIIEKISQNLKIFSEIIKLPVVELSFVHNKSENNDVEATYKYFTKRHPKYKIFQNKQIGIALINIASFASGDEYLKSVNGKNSAFYYARKAKGRNYMFCEIDRNHYVEDIYQINTSAQERQGRKMANSYLQKIERFEDKSNYRYFGVLDSSGRLRSYCNIGYYGDFALVSQLLGHKDFLNDGVMYLMMTEIVSELIREKKVTFLMYDTFFGAKDGLKMFKEKLGFLPYRIQWRLNTLK